MAVGVEVTVAVAVAVDVAVAVTVAVAVGVDVAVAVAVAVGVAVAVAVPVGVAARSIFARNAFSLPLRAGCSPLDAPLKFGESVSPVTYAKLPPGFAEIPVPTSSLLPPR